MTSESDDKEREDDLGQNWGTGSLARPAREEESHWLHGLVKDPEPTSEPTSETHTGSGWLGGLIRESVEQPAPPRVATEVVPVAKPDPPAEPEKKALPPKLLPLQTGATSPPERLRFEPGADTLSVPSTPEPARSVAQAEVSGPARSPRTKRRSEESHSSTEQAQLYIKAADLRERAVLYKAMASMLEAGLPIFGVFQFLAEQCENQKLSQACQRTAQGLAAGHSLSILAQAERRLFSDTTAKMLEVGMRSGQLVAVLKKVAEDEDRSWQMRQRISSQLLYPAVLAMLALGAAVALPPLALSGILKEVVSLTEEPPALTKAILSFSSTLSSPVVLVSVLVFFLMSLFLLSNPSVRERLFNLEKWLWKVPWLGSLLQTAASVRFLQIFAITYEVGMMAPQCLVLASQASGSRVVAGAGKRMNQTLLEGEPLDEAIRCGNFLPALALEAVRAGEEVGKVPPMMRKAADILETELEYRIEAALSVLEPLLLLVLGIFVGFFALGCLLPILKLAETL